MIDEFQVGDPNVRDFGVGVGVDSDSGDVEILEMIVKRFLENRLIG